ncbi:MAG: hypothetical protein AAGU27_13880 [Dehalobacterium sp.]
MNKRVAMSELSPLMAETLQKGREVILTSIKTIKQLYRLKLFFPGLKYMKILYPFLSTLSFLMPVCWVLRGIKCLLFKHRHMFQMINNVHSVSEEDIIRIKNLHKKAGLFEVRRR